MLVADLPLAKVVFEVAFVPDGRARVNFHDDVGEGPQEKPVVGDEHESSVVGLEELLQPLHRRKVEVVRRLVEEEEVGPRCKHPRKLGAHAPAAGKRGERLSERVSREAEASEGDFHPRLDIVASEVLELGLKFAKLPEDGLVPVAKGVLQLGDAPFHFRETGDSAQRIFKKRFVRRERLWILPRKADTRRGLNCKLALVGGHLAKDYPEER